MNGRLTTIAALLVSVGLTSCALRDSFVPFLARSESTDVHFDGVDDAPVAKSRIADGEQVPPGFEEVAAEFSHHWNAENHPFTGAAVIDVDGDGRFEIFVGGGRQQADALLTFEEGRLVDRIRSTGISHPAATYGALAMDLDRDGRTDLAVARSTGLYVYWNEGSGPFRRDRVELPPELGSVPFAIVAADVDHDGHADLLVSRFASQRAYRQGLPDRVSTALLLGRGGRIFEDASKASGVGEGGAVGATFADLDADGWLDLVIARHRGGIELLHNEGNASFARVPIGTGVGLWKGLATGDVDGDGDLDFFAGNVGSVSSDAAGPLGDDARPEWLLLRNDGDLALADVTEEYGLEGFQYGMGAVFEDLDLDGQLDLLVAQDAMDRPGAAAVAGRTLLRRSSAAGSRFEPVWGFGLENPFNGQSPIIVDFDGDARPDVLWLNVNGPLRAFRNISENHFLTVRLPDDAASVGTIVTLQTDGGLTMTRVVAPGSGLLTDQAPEVFFGLGQEQPKRLEIRALGGAVQTMTDLPLDGRVVVSRK